MHPTRERRPRRGGPPAPPLLDPRRDRLRVSARLAAQRRGLADERLIELALAGALEDPGDLGQEVGAAARQLGQRGYRGGLLVASELMPPRPVPRLPRQLRDEDPVSLRASIDHSS